MYLFHAENTPEAVRASNHKLAEDIAIDLYESGYSKDGAQAVIMQLWEAAFAEGEKTEENNAWARDHES